MPERTVTLNLNEWTLRELDRMAAKHGVTLDEIVAAALATARGDSWHRDDHGEIFRQDLLRGRAIQGVLSPSTTVVIPDEVLHDVAAKFFAEDGEKAGVHALLNWWNTVSPLDLPVSTEFGIFGQYQKCGYSYLEDCPDSRKPESFEGQSGSAKAHGLYVEFRFHRADDRDITIYNMNGECIEGCTCDYDAYEWWMLRSLRRAFELEWKAFAPIKE